MEISARYFASSIANLGYLFLFLGVINFTLVVYFGFKFAPYLKLGISYFNKNKAKDRENKILFVNASLNYGQHPDVRKLNILTKENISEIATAYKEFKETPGFSKIIDIQDIRDNDYNLNVSLYVFPTEETEEIDVHKEWEDLKKITGEIIVVDEKIEGYLKELK